MGVEKNGGTRLFSVSGHIKRPGVYELPHSIGLTQIIYDVCGGMRDDSKPLKMVIPGGSSTPVLKADEIDVLCTIEAMRDAGSMLGTGGAIVMEEGVCAVRAATNLAKFYAHESCGQCTPCREGAGWLAAVLSRIEHGEGQDSDIDLLKQVADRIEGNTICALGDAAAWPVQAFIKKFRGEFEAHMGGKGCPHEPDTWRPVYTEPDEVLQAGLA
ncbi:MAG: SLBB domain-containing protein [Acidobacteria bacterium]|nr:SLBB domain-containing protein [Acidobacteriota bacterium]